MESYKPAIRAMPTPQQLKFVLYIQVLAIPRDVIVLSVGQYDRLASNCGQYVFKVD